jgi:hypothetical protein
MTFIIPCVYLPTARGALYGFLISLVGWIGCPFALDLGVGWNGFCSGLVGLVSWWFGVYRPFVGCDIL